MAEHVKYRVVVLVLPGTSLSSIAVPVDVFSSAQTLWENITGQHEPKHFDVTLVSVDGKPVSVMGDVSLSVHASIDEIATADLIVITALIPNQSIHLQRSQLVEWLQKKHSQGSRLASFCTGSFLLAATGLLDGKSATTHWGAVKKFAAMYPKVKLMPHRLITDESPLYTSGGSHGATDLCFYLVEKMVNRETALNWSRVMVKDYRNATQSPYAVFQGNRKHNDAAITLIQDYLEEGYAAPSSVQEMAKQVGLGKRTFERRFKAATGESPVVYLQRLRIEAAKRMLEMGNDGVEQITARVGYEDSATFSKLFSRYVGIPPAAYRKKFFQHGQRS